jgi:L-ascorbate metabolism protein UlaG (beta-lactamase superfamily)
MIRRLATACGLALIALAAPATAQERIPSHCVALADAGPERLWQARFGAPLAEDRVRISYVDHSTFVIETAGGLTAATDYSGRLGATALVPDVVTMNNAHRTHWTPAPDARIPHVLRGWGEGILPADHYLDLGEMLVRNVTTDVLRGGLPRPDGNSIFVFEVAGLCIGHLGHLHHEPTPAQYARIGRLDVVMVPVDGGLTLDSATLIEVVRRLRSSVVLPMHWFSGTSLERFLAAMAGEFAVERRAESWVEVALHDLPSRPTILVLPPAWLVD